LLLTCVQLSLLNVLALTPPAAAAAAAGFCTGYVGAIKGSVRLVSGVSCKAATAATCLAVRLLRGAFGLLVRML
jgi:hypothetical protein